MEGIMKKIVIMMVLVLISLSLYAGRSATPHPVYFELRDADGNIPAAEDLEVKCWLERNPEEVLDLENSNVLFPIKDVFLQIQCSGFSSWSAGDLLHVEISNTKKNEFLAHLVVLDFDNFQIFFDNHLKKGEEVKE
jgi:hypothetical protein